MNCILTGTRHKISRHEVHFIYNMFLLFYISSYLNRWYKLCNKASKGKKEPKERGELELTIQLKEDFPADFGTLDRAGHRSKAKRSSSLQEKPPVIGMLHV